MSKTKLAGFLQAEISVNSVLLPRVPRERDTLLQDVEVSRVMLFDGEGRPVAPLPRHQVLHVCGGKVLIRSEADGSWVYRGGSVLEHRIGESRDERSHSDVRDVCGGGVVGELLTPVSSFLSPRTWYQQHFRLAEARAEIKRAIPRSWERVKTRYAPYGCVVPFLTAEQEALTFGADLNLDTKVSALRITETGAFVRDSTFGALLETYGDPGTIRIAADDGAKVAHLHSASRQGAVSERMSASALEYMVLHAADLASQRLRWIGDKESQKIRFFQVALKVEGQTLLTVSVVERLTTSRALGVDAGPPDGVFGSIARARAMGSVAPVYAVEISESAAGLVTVTRERVS